MEFDFVAFRRELGNDLLQLASEPVSEPASEPVSGSFPDTLVNELFIELVARYTKPYRTYHGVDHLFHVVSDVSALGGPAGLSAEDLAVTRLAAWFHDAIYDVAAKDNEEQSAMFAQEWLTRFGVATSSCQRVGDLVRATAYLTHNAEDTDDMCTHVLRDADLAILATGAATYDQYTVNVRNEYSSVSDADWRLGRSKVLEVFMGASSLYRTPGTTGWHERALANLQREHAKLLNPL